MARSICIAFSRAVAAAVAALATAALHHGECDAGHATSLSACHSVESIVGALASTEQNKDTHMLAV